MNAVWFYIGWMMTILILLISFLFYLSEKDKDNNYMQLPHNNGRMTKLEYEDHTYIGWSCNFGCSMTHDPECKCLKEKNGR